MQSYSEDPSEADDTSPVSQISERTGLPNRTHLFSLHLAQLVKDLPAMRETWIQSLDWEDALEKGKATYSTILGLPLWLSWQRICLQCRTPEFDPWIGKMPWRREWLPTPVFLPGESHGQRTLAGCSPRGHKESDMTDELSTVQQPEKWPLGGYFETLGSQNFIYYLVSSDLTEVS